MEKSVHEILQELRLGSEFRPSVEAFLKKLALLEPKADWRKRLTRVHSDSPEAREHRRLMATAIEAGALNQVERFVLRMRVALSIPIKMTSALSDPRGIRSIPMGNIGQIQTRALKKLERQFQDESPTLAKEVADDRIKRSRPRKAVLSMCQTQGVVDRTERRESSVGWAH